MPTFGVTKEIEFCAGHRVPDHEGKCFSPHGHQYKVIVTIAGHLQEKGAAAGMVLDFSDIKKHVLQPIHDKFDHGFIVKDDDWPMLIGLGEANEGDEFYGQRLVDHKAGEENRYGWKVVVVDFSPTAENLAKWCYDFAKAQMQGHMLAGWVADVEVYETPTSSAFFPMS